MQLRMHHVKQHQEAELHWVPRGLSRRPRMSLESWNHGQHPHKQCDNPCKYKACVRRLEQYGRILLSRMLDTDQCLLEASNKQNSKEYPPRKLWTGPRRQWFGDALRQTAIQPHLFCGWGIGEPLQAKQTFKNEKNMLCLIVAGSMGSTFPVHKTMPILGNAPQAEVNASDWVWQSHVNLMSTEKYTV